MSTISKLQISSVRNIESIEISPSSQLNLVWGENGSGKTSVLEAIHLLATGRSFRSSKTDPLIRHCDTEAVIFAELAGDQQVGLSKSRRQKNKLRLQNENQRNWDNVARLIPVQILDATSFQLLEGGPKSRRRFLDWGVFHVEQSFLSNWRKASKCIANRNLLLKQSRPDHSQLSAWSAELVIAANDIDIARQKYFDDFVDVFVDVYSSMNGDHLSDVQLSYDRGWDAGADLEDVLRNGMENDLRYGATQNGPHRADIFVKWGNNKAIDILSRGQQKMLVSALKISQGKILSQELGRKCIYLVDDLPAELDKVNRASVLDELQALGGQIFVTSVERDALDLQLDAALMTTFHVERGTITT